jgi:hypothetical protein
VKITVLPVTGNKVVFKDLIYPNHHRFYTQNEKYQNFKYLKYRYSHVCISDLKIACKSGFAKIDFFIHNDHSLYKNGLKISKNQKIMFPFTRMKPFILSECPWEEPHMLFDEQSDDFEAKLSFKVLIWDEAPYVKPFKFPQDAFPIIQKVQNDENVIEIEYPSLNDPKYYVLKYHSGLLNWGRRWINELVAIDPDTDNFPVRIEYK